VPKNKSLSVGASVNQMYLQKTPMRIVNAVFTRVHV